MWDHFCIGFMEVINNVASWLVARFAIVPRIFQITLNPCIVWKVHYCGKKSWGACVFVQKNVCVKNSEHFFLKKSCFSPCPKRIRLLEPLLKNTFSTNFQGTGPWEGPIHFSRFVLRVHNCSELFQSWSWSQEKKGRPFPQATAKFKVQTFPKRIRLLIKPLLNNIFPQISKALGHERAQFTLVGLFSGSQLQRTFPELIMEPREERKTLYKNHCQVPNPNLSQKNRPLVKPLLRAFFFTHFQGTGTGPWEGPIHFSRFVLRVHNCSKLFQSWSWNQEKKATPFTKATGFFSFRFSFPFFPYVFFLFFLLFFSLFLSLINLLHGSLRNNLRWKR